MALATSLSVGLLGIDGSLVKVEADLAQGVPMLSITGLPDASLNEARDRMRAAISNSGESCRAVITAMKASTTAGSNWAPAQRWSSSMAHSMLMALR